MRRFTRFLAMVVTVVLLGCAGAKAEEIIRWNGEAWTVRDGIETLDYSAMGAAELYDVQTLMLPDSLRRIEQDALNSFAGASLHIPEGVEAMASQCLWGSAVERLTLPSTLRELSGQSFDSTDYLQYIRIAEDNPYFKVVDNVVFTKDGATLVCYPAGKRDVHYDVPSGVVTIAPYAFCGNDWLRTLSAPMGLETIGKAALEGCGYLTSVSLPLSVKEIGEWAFAVCASLERISVPQTASVAENSFAYSYKLSGAQEDNAIAESGDDYFAEERGWRGVLLTTDLVWDRIAIHAQPSEDSETLFLAERGSYVEAQGARDGYVEIRFFSDQDSESPATGYVREAEVYFDNERYEPLFTIETVRPKMDLVGSLRENRVLPTVTRTNRRPEATCEFIVSGQEGQWLTGMVTLCDEDGWKIEERRPLVLWFGDIAECRRAWTGDQLRLGFVVASEVSNRVNLRQAPDKSAAVVKKYFSGMQLEILAEQDGWYHVRMNDGLSGYMMADYVMVVEQEAF